MQVYSSYTHQTNNSTNTQKQINLMLTAWVRMIFCSFYYQLRYQDPTSPVDDKEFIAQLAQFSSLEQMQNLNDTMLTMMESQQKLTALSQATAMIGKMVEIYSEDGESSAE